MASNGLTLTVRDVPEPIVAALRERASRNRRSLQKEMLAILQGAVFDRADLERRLAEYRNGLPGYLTIDEINGAIVEGRP